jgi:hypothetical protein
VSWSILDRDWWGASWLPGARHALVADSEHLWLLAGDARPAKTQPGLAPGDFREGLWQADVAELFIASADRQRYLEFNLSPTGAWWCAGFDGPRQRRQGTPMPRVRTQAKSDPASGWQAALAIPLSYLQEQLDFAQDCPLNVTLILQSPEQRFFSATDLGPGNPDFHQPARFAAPEWRPLLP